MQSSDMFEVFDRTYTLQRYPHKNNDDLRAWDAADHYLLATLKGLDIDLSDICIINDYFGALTIPLLQHKPVCYNDSWLSKEAIYQNIELNNLDKSLSFLSQIDELNDHPNSSSIIIGRVPKSKNHLAHLLQHLHQWAQPGCTLLLAGMDKHLSKGQFDLLESYFGPSRFYPGVKKARIWEAKIDKTLISKPLPNNAIELPEFELSLTNQANVFSQEKLDIGTRFFLENFSKLPEKKHVADLGCGNGTLGLAYLRLHPQSHMLFADESFQAIKSCKENWKKNLPKTSAVIRADDGLKQSKPSEFDLIVCNPPFHFQHTLGTDIAFSLFKDAFRSLKKTGEFWIVANRHLAYHISLNKLFGNCSTEASNKKFVILKAVKYR
jgi:23S rRNA (guanine1835-N2)-methyltransferase